MQNIQATTPLTTNTMTRGNITYPIQPSTSLSAFGVQPPTLPANSLYSQDKKPLPDVRSEISALREEITQLKSRLDDNDEEVDSKVDRLVSADAKLEKNFLYDMERLKQELRADVKALKQEIHSNLESLKQELRSEITTNRMQIQRLEYLNAKTWNQAAHSSNRVLRNPLSKDHEYLTIWFVSIKDGQYFASDPTQTGPDRLR
ncbi:hypothetical protein DL93DRAFT_1864840 [Clavulina sp. PMI_390]|nr:hypothetical protein DL93DRAFT_1864840 [Clavulina sp. PMI_390]